jgi:hypothetical protein
MSFASAHVSNVKTLVSIQPASAFILEHQQHDHSSCISVIETGAGGHKRITARGKLANAAFCKIKLIMFVDEGGRM